MHQKKSDLQIGEEGRRRRISSDFNPTPPVLSPPKHLQIPAPPPKSQQNQLQTLFRHESICSIPSTSQTLLSTPHKRPIISQIPSSLSHSASLSSLQQTHNFDSNSLSFSSFTSFSTIPFASRSLGIKLIRHLRRARVQFRFLLLLSLPFFYFFVSSPRRSFILTFLSILAFAIALLVSLNLGFARLPSVSLLLKRSLPIKFPTSSAPSKPFQTVLWSIGSNPKSEQKPNSGSWVHVYSNGDIYEGEFHEGKCSGSGVYYYYMSGRYEGDWIDEKYDGYGVETWARGSRYRGQYRQGLRHGVGVYRFYTGDVYAGEWSKGQSHGCGVHTCEDGSKYVGEFKWGVKHGLGYYHFRNGDTYAGEYFADKIHGFGVYRFGNGHRYEGGWHEGRRQGLGMYTFRNGETQSGHWQNGVLNVPRTQNNDPESPYAANHSKVHNAVQEARRAAEKAYNMEKVDERVNRAVAAANKAANAARVAAIKAVQNRMHTSNNGEDFPIPNV